jgi:hypothetical protein
MPAHGFASGVGADDLTAAVISSCKQSGLMLGVQIGVAEEGAELRFTHGSTSHVKALLLNLASVGVMVDVALCEVSSDTEVSACGMRAGDGRVEELDLTARAASLLKDRTGGGPVHEKELVAGQLAAQLLGRDPDDFRAVRMLSFKAKGSDED